MADAPVVHIGENSPEHVAYELMMKIYYSEFTDGRKADRKWLLSTYVQCRDAVVNGIAPK